VAQGDVSHVAEKLWPGPLLRPACYPSTQFASRSVGPVIKHALATILSGSDHGQINLPRHSCNIRGPSFGARRIAGAGDYDCLSGLFAAAGWPEGKREASPLILFAINTNNRPVLVEYSLDDR